MALLTRLRIRWVVRVVNGCQGSIGAAQGYHALTQLHQRRCSLLLVWYFARLVVKAIYLGPWYLPALRSRRQRLDVFRVALLVLMMLSNFRL